VQSCRKNTRIVRQYRTITFREKYKKITMTSYTNNGINFEQFTGLRSLNISSNYILCTTRLPPTLNVLYAHNDTNVNDRMVSMCTHLKKLIVYNNPNIITCAPFAQHLVELDASFNCGIDDVGLQTCYRLKKLDAGSNPKITTCVPFAKTLKSLNAKDTCGITDYGLRTCYRLKILRAINNPKISRRPIKTKN